MKVWGWAEIKLTIPGSAIRLATDCSNDYGAWHSYMTPNSMTILIRPNKKKISVSGNRSENFSKGRHTFF